MGIVATCRRLCAAVLLIHPWATLAEVAFSHPAEVCSDVAVWNKTYDYIIIGSGAGGIPMADRLTEAGHTVLMLEKGPPSTGLWGGTMKAPWLEGTNLTRFDVPGLSNQIWHDPTNITCADFPYMSGCLLGGGTAVNSGLWWKPHPDDWDYAWPAGWKSPDLAGATDRVFSRIPGTTVPSLDGKLYLQQGFDVLSKGLTANGWTSIVPNDHPDRKNWTFGHATNMFEHAERGGPLATYLVTASRRKEFTLWMNTTVRRVTRAGDYVTGVQIECGDPSANVGTIKVKSKTGRVIVSAGTYGSAKVLFRSGIGPTDQLNVVKNSTDGDTMISSDQWINLPVGHNLDDHVGTDIEIAHPEVVFYDFYAAWDTPNADDKAQYLENRTGILTQAAPNLGPIFWEIIHGTDGIDRHLHWQSRVEGAKNTDHSYCRKASMTITQYLGTGAQSRGRLSINKLLNMQATTAPYLHNDADKAAVIAGLEKVQGYFKSISNLTWIRPAPNETATHYVNSIPATPDSRGSNHWIGSAKIGLDDGRQPNGTAVVDADTKVYGTANLFVVDASIFPGMMTGNPSAMIVAASEHAAERIMKLPFPKAVRSKRRRL
ncbi:hypothetical protein PG985_000225 [Apiospora marii]|uniref:uncharacterized protein n=1 Tax=Apiospora marii TaxID=335849 RepID=UPI00312D3B2B